MGRRTPLFDLHTALGARLVDFGGWEMPLHYGSQIEEHHAVRNDAGLFDVSHMTVVDLRGTGARDYLRRLLANDVDRLQAHGRALYSCMLNEAGGVIDDLIVYFMTPEWYRVVVNAATRDKDLAWMEAHLAGFDATLTERADLAMIAVQGPNARTKAEPLLPAAAIEAVRALVPFSAVEAGEWFIARTGYTGEDGLEVMLPAARAEAFARGLIEAGVHPCGLGARDTLRLEAGMALYGQDMDEETSPLAAGLAWTVSWTDEARDFIGRAALAPQRENPPPMKQVGLLLEGRGVLRAHQPVSCDGGAGEISSGTFSPTLQRAIALARVPRDCGDSCQVDIRGKLHPARVVKPPFVRHGKPCIEL
ncbi:glycine cleavage system aminomethyltransferase GcvT [Endothiovibrio diazotrophicus]